MISIIFSLNIIISCENRIAIQLIFTPNGITNKKTRIHIKIKVKNTIGFLYFNRQIKTIPFKIYRTAFLLQQEVLKTKTKATIEKYFNIFS